MAPLNTIFLLGAPGTGAQALCAALQARLEPGAASLLWGHALNDLPGLGRTARPSLVLLMGLDQPCPASHRPAQEAADAQLRAELDRARMAYRVVYGQAEQRLAHALIAIKNIATSTESTSASGAFDSDLAADTQRTARLRAWNCEKCSDPECEHRLFSALTGRDARTA